MSINDYDDPDAYLEEDDYDPDAYDDAVEPDPPYEPWFTSADEAAKVYAAMLKLDPANYGRNENEQTRVVFWRELGARIAHDLDGQPDGHEVRLFPEAPMVVDAVVAALVNETELPPGRIHVHVTATTAKFVIAAPDGTSVEAVFFQEPPREPGTWEASDTPPF